MNRFSVLDSWRGIAACFVAMLHFGGDSHLSELSIVKYSWLFVDMFFVLSGFVIAANYQQRILEGRLNIWTFMVLRFGRLYPLHVAILFVLLLRKVIQASIPSLNSMAASPAFQSTYDSPASFAAHVFLVHGFGFTDHASWNGPSWSISNEFFAYFIFAGLLMIFRQRIRLALLAALVFGPLTTAVLGDYFYDIDFRLLRCLAGFLAGVLTWNLYNIKKINPNTAVELLIVCIAFGFIWMAGTIDLSVLSLLTPYVFAALVFVFAFEKGVISNLLKSKLFLLLGTLSYSIYMTHTLVMSATFDAAKVAGAMTGHTFFVATDTVRHLNLGPWFSDLGAAGYMLIVIGVSYLTCRFIENPWRLWFRQLAATAQSKLQGISPGVVNPDGR